MLTCKRVEMIWVERKELEKFIEETYNLEFDIIADLITLQDVCHNFTLKRKPLSADDFAWLEEWKEDDGFRPEFITPVILQDMVNRGLIEEGHYIVYMGE